MSYTTIPAAAAEELVSAGKVRVLDVRNPDEWAGLGTIPGATLLPVDLVASAAATLPRDGAPILVCCEHGVRSVTAARFLDAAGFEGVLNLAGGMSTWTGPRQFGPRDPDPLAGPCPWLLQCADLLRPPAALDVACGRGRHALLLASAGFTVRGVDSDAGAIAALEATAERLGLPVRAEVADLEAPGADLGVGLYDLVLVVNYLHRPLFPALRRALRPGGLLVYETFTEAQAARGRPTSPAHLLKAGEIEDLVAPLEIVRRREGEFEGRFVASVAARRGD